MGAMILVVDDNPLDRKLLQAHLAPHGYKLEFAQDGVEAMQMLERDPLPYDLVILDRIMPRLSGLEVLTRIKEDARLRTLPVIMHTAASSQEQVVEGIRAGAYYYLVKPYDPETLRAMVATASRDFGEYRRLQEQLKRGLECLSLIRNATLRIRTVQQAHDTAIVLANACPDPPNAVIGLTELLVNAVEHGNLGISYEEKTALNASNRWSEEIERRLASPQYSGRYVVVNLERDDDSLRFTIRDEGAGFRWASFLTVDPHRAFHTHGRGIAISRAVSFDAVEYRGRGNEVVATIHL
jgi:phosphoserine phosphatase RsbU/P